MVNNIPKAKATRIDSKYPSQDSAAINPTKIISTGPLSSTHS